jgi:hypothetical protein
MGKRLGAGTVGAPPGLRGAVCGKEVPMGRGGRGRTIEIGEKRTHSVSGGSLAERWDAHQDRLACAP